MGFDCRICTGLGKQTLGGHKKNLVCARTHEKGAATPQDFESDLPVRVQEPLAEAWVNSGLLQGSGALNATVHAQDILTEVVIFFIIPSTV